MYSESDIDGAVEAGALSREAATALRAHVAGQRAMPAVDEESFRLLTGFNDIFVSIAAVLMLVATGWIGNMIRLLAPEHGPSPFIGFAVAATAWGLAEYFTRERRMALPSIILLLAYAGGLFLGFAVLIGVTFGLEHDHEQNERVLAMIVAAAAALTAGGVWLHWRRFMVPITVAAGAATLAGVLMALVVAAVPTIGGHILKLLLVAGLGVFSLAMWWDMSDRTRTTRRSDVAFWLHLLAAPMIVHPIFAMMGMLEGTAAPAQASFVILIYIALGFVALAIDRRALMVSALVYVLYALSSLIEQSGAVDLSFGLTALIIGSALLLLSAFWTVARRHVVGLLPDDLALRLPVIDRLQAA
ncbi:hypothetical protein [Rhizorhabdus dicambivorans]|uniref:DUF2157 domain-containing protein n=1 Tax=Rhizorhabdus dicambivorans TaxID=1850238 RepID=A0A2A4FZB3_9SPHN|nr:hypothetical protein [Rhizorhabdus dicambivorans]ATE66711.1 hypothetical protein CMV14_21735 [Rhizorhabdus dicambivorans]PCE43802.1 hypothetical protein COO09_02410 [Rhizorhabdus dicambivorans]